MLSVAELLAGDGPLAQSLSGFAPRLQQQQMAAAVEQALTAKSVLVAEAGTGTGKTFAYLVPSLLSGKKVLISTGTKNLQDQFFYKDLPVVQKALDIPVSVALLKGRANYLCPHRLRLAQQESQPLNKQALNKLRMVMEWAGRTRTGDRAEMTGIAEDDSIWPRVTSSAENCLGTECPQLQECHLIQARRAAQAADVVVINHHLLFADMALREQGFGELLPLADAVIIDEAHHLTETAAAFFGTSLSGNQLLELCRDSENEFYTAVNEGHDLPRATETLSKAVRDLRLAMGEAQRKGSWAELAGDKSLQTAADQVQAGLAALQGLLKPMAERSKGLENCLRRCKELADRFAQLTTTAGEGFIHWFEAHRRTFTLHLTPLDISEYFQSQMGAMQ
ncbi:MAG: ATP-dependent DNA helicase, partial [Gammaproteobacteria bacterium]|nr:ATP-dependent DNA helicase [Gammaproteobacteria bacterium]